MWSRLEVHEVIRDLVVAGALFLFMSGMATTLVLTSGKDRGSNVIFAAFFLVLGSFMLWAGLAQVRVNP